MSAAVSEKDVFIPPGVVECNAKWPLPSTAAFTDPDRLTFTINGVTFDVDPFDAEEELARIDKQFAGKENECMQCLAQFPARSDEPGEREKPCPACGADYLVIGPSPDLANAMVTLLNDRYGVKCSKRAAIYYRNRVIETTTAQKKTA